MRLRFPNAPEWFIILASSGIVLGLFGLSGLWWYYQT